MKLLKTLCLLQALTGNVFAQDEDEPQFRIVESHSIEPPLTMDQFEHWVTKGSAVLMQNKIMLVPEVPDRRGAIIAKTQVPNGDSWLLDVRLKIGNEIPALRGGNGVGIYYLRSVNQEDIGQGQMGYSKMYDGLGIFLNTILAKKNKDQVVENYIQAFTNNGEKQINMMKLKDEKYCLK